MKVKLAYGKGHLDLEVPEDRCTVIEPSALPGLSDEKAALTCALDSPIASNPLRDLVRKHPRICIIFTDITRATPNHRLIPWLLEYLQDLPKDKILLLNALGTHRPNTKSELERMLTPEVVRNYHVLNHECENPELLVQVGHTQDGTPALLNRHCVQADLRIVTGFIEPHFFAGFSGGPKGIMPGVAGLQTVMSSHGSRNISDPNATFGITRGNPLWEELRDIALAAGPSFLVNVALNDQREITGIFAGDLVEAHARGCEFVRESAMQACPKPFDFVVTTNSGYPLDLNLYQGVKGMSAAARILKPGGTMILACECSEGVPPDSSYDRLLRSARSPEELLARLASPGFSHPEQWQAQIQALLQRRARILVYSSLSPEVTRSAHLEPCANIQHEIDRLLFQEPRARMAILPQGPLTIPYLQR